MYPIEENKRIAQRWLQLVSAGKVEEICAMTHPTWQMHGGPPALPAGPDGVRFLFSSFDHANVKQQWTVNIVVAEGDKVAVRATNVGVQDNFFGIPGRGKQQVFTSIFIFHIVDGMILETWRNADDLGRVLQLGARLMPPALAEA